MLYELTDEQVATIKSWAKRANPAHDHGNGPVFQALEHPVGQVYSSPEIRCPTCNAPDGAWLDDPR